MMQGRIGKKSYGFADFRTFNGLATVIMIMIKIPVKAQTLYQASTQ